jgi:hypothetical protein
VTKDPNVPDTPQSDLPQASEYRTKQAKNRTCGEKEPSQDSRATGSAFEDKDHGGTSLRRPSGTANPATISKQTAIDQAQLVTALWSKMGELGMQRREILLEVKSKKMGALKRLNIVDADIAGLRRTIDVFEEEGKSADLGTRYVRR